MTGLNDEVLDRAELADACGLTGEAALLAELQATRTGRMRDIVGTLQAEQDAIIRSAHSGILVVQGGPGTGKTAVALHRAAYLLYTHRHLAERGVLVVGHSTTFLALPATLAKITAAETAKEGRLAVIVPDTKVTELGDAVSRAVPDVSYGENPDLTSPVVLLGARQAKGLEFDSVLIADPAAILAGSPRGRSDLYVAMTRSAQRLGVLHPGQPPAELAALRHRGAV